MHSELSCIGTANTSKDSREAPTDTSAPITGQSSASGYGPLTGRSNGFDLIRLVAAIMVILGHAYVLSGAASPGLLGNSIAAVGVKIFFVTSGFLIAQSWLTDPAPLRFALRRILRIVPGLAVAVLVSVLLLGPALTTLPLTAYAKSPGTARYLWNILFYPVYQLPGVFAANIYPAAVNGSIWSLPVEVFMYVLTPFILGSSREARRVVALLFTLTLALAGLYFVRVAPLAATPVVYGTSIVSLLDVAAYFHIGLLYAVFGLQRFGRPALALVLLSAACCIVRAPVPAEVLLLLLLPFAVISLGLVHIAPLAPLLRRRDISYGLYLYGFPVQQVVSALSPVPPHPGVAFVVAFPFVAGLAMLSWLLVERRLIGWKPKGRY